MRLSLSAALRPHNSKAVIALHKDRIYIYIQVNGNDGKKMPEGQLRNAKGQNATDKEQSQQVNDFVPPCFPLKQLQFCLEAALSSLHRLLATQAEEQKLSRQEIFFKKPHAQELVYGSPAPLFELRWIEVFRHGCRTIQMTSRALARADLLDGLVKMNQNNFGTQMGAQRKIPTTDPDDDWQREP